MSPPLSLLLHPLSLVPTDMAETLRYLLVGSGEITGENVEVKILISVPRRWCVVVLPLTIPLLQLTSRSPNEVYEILSVAG